MNYLMPFEGVFPMHCSCNYDPKTLDASLFFGLSGTGKTTLSADPLRILIGGDEHGWSSNGIFNFEGGCYAKTDGLSAKKEPEIFAAATAYGTVLENVALDESGRPNFTKRLLGIDESEIENGRAAYSRESIANIDPSGRAGIPKDIFFLSADAFGVLPPIVKLTPEQAMYYFLSGYTAKLAGTERGVNEPQATFSACFGQPFLAHPPEVYAKLLKEKVQEHGSTVWMINTGWTGGPHGIGHRMSLEYTRALIRAAQSGELNDVQTRIDPTFGFEVPISCPGIPSDILDPRQTWKNKKAYDTDAAMLRAMFEKNATQFDLSAL